MTTAERQLHILMQKYTELILDLIAKERSKIKGSKFLKQLIWIEVTGETEGGRQLQNRKLF